MKKKLLWALLAVALIAVVILAIALPKADGKEKVAASENTSAESVEETAAEPAAEPEPEKESGPAQEEGELPLDVTQVKPVSASSGEQAGEPSAQPSEQGEISTAVDPETGIELEEDELPLDTP